MSNAESILATARRALHFCREVRLISASTVYFGSIDGVDGLRILFRERGDRQLVFRPADILSLDVLPSAPPRGRKAAARDIGKTGPAAAPVSPGRPTAR